MHPTTIPRPRTFLFAPVSFWSGLSGVLHLQGNYYHFRYQRSQAMADSGALYADWCRVANDMHRLIPGNTVKQPCGNG